MQPNITNNYIKNHETKYADEITGKDLDKDSGDIISTAKFDLLLNQNGLLYFEIHEQKGSEILKMLKDLGFTSIELKQDLHGKDRMVKAKWKL